jgi:hypothetical protein
MTPVATLSFAGEHVLLRRKRGGAPQVARVLGRETRGGVERVYLDTRVHEPCDDVIGDWQVSGAVATVLTRGVSTSTVAATGLDNSSADLS